MVRGLDNIDKSIEGTRFDPVREKSLVKEKTSLMLMVGLLRASVLHD